MPSTLLEDKVVIVTGAGGGIGRAHCLELAKHGAIVIVNDVGEGRHEVLAEIERTGGRAIVDDTSVVDFEAVRDLVTSSVERFGRLDAVVNNAGILRDGLLTNLSEQDWDSVIEVHLKGTFAVSRHACDYWRSRFKAGETVSGRVVNTTSGTGLFGNAGQANYGAAKAAIANLTVITAMEAQRYGVTVNAISPIARTRMTEDLPMMRASAAEDGWDRFDPANSSPVVAWLVSDRSAWLNGEVVRIDGEKLLRVAPWAIDESAAYVAKSGERIEADELDNAMTAVFGGP